MEGGGISRSLFEMAATIPKIKNKRVGLVRLDKSISIFMSLFIANYIKDYNDHNTLGLPFPFG